MTVHVPPAPDISRAWLATVGAVEALGGTAIHVMTSVAGSNVENPVIRAAVDATLVPGSRRRRIQSVETVAGTIFPSALYRSQPRAWSPDLTVEERRKLDEAAADLYADYGLMRPVLATDPGNQWGTYFGRMVDWPGSEGRNQLDERVVYLRNMRAKGKRRANSADIAVAGEGELAGSAAVGVQIHSSGDRRYLGGPCLVHVDLSVHSGQLHMLAVYRHWHLITRGYGNLLGLTRLLAFLSEQTGFPMGELAVVAGTASTERGDWGGRSGVEVILARATREWAGRS